LSAFHGSLDLEAGSIQKEKKEKKEKRASFETQLKQDR